MFFLDVATLKQLRLVSTALCTAALWHVKQLRLYRRPGREFVPWDPLESLPCLNRIKLRIGNPSRQDWEAYKKHRQRTTLALGARRCLPLLAMLHVGGIDWQNVDDFSVGRLQHDLQLATNLTKLNFVSCEYLPSALLASCTSVCDLKIVSNTVLESLEGPLMTLSNLQRLNLRWNRVVGDRFGDRMWPRLLKLVPANLPKLTDLEEVVLVGKDAVSTLAGLHHLTRLWVEVHQDDGMVQVGPIFLMRGLADLHLSAEGPGQLSDHGEGAPSLADLKRAQQLRALTLHILEIWDDAPASALPWHPLCNALMHLTALTQLHVKFYPETYAPSSVLRLLAPPALVNLRLSVRPDAPNDKIWPILCQAAPLLQHLDLRFQNANQLCSLVSCVSALSSLTCLSLSLFDNSPKTLAAEVWPSAACVTCHSSLQYLQTCHMFHAANIDRDLPLLTALAARHQLAIQFAGRASWDVKMGQYELQHSWRERVDMSSAVACYSVELHPLPDPTWPSSSKHEFRHWPYIL